MSNIDPILSLALQAQEPAPWLTINKLIEWLNKPIATLGRTEVTISGLATAFIVFLLFLTVSAVIQRLLAPWLNRRLQKSPGVAYAIQRITHYLIILIGLAVSAQVIGLDMSSFAIVVGFLSVGIGFGLQNVTSNFISGLILLLERPISVGDLVSVEGQVGTVQEIRMRSTVIQTFDNISIIVPNSRFIDSVLINWSLGDPKVRIHIAVGVAYGSDLKKVTEVLMRVAGQNPLVLKLPEPEVFFLEFGDSSLNFELLVWLMDPLKQKAVKSELNLAVDAAFREAGITIPFPQRDVHIQSTEAVNRLTSAINPSKHV